MDIQYTDDGVKIDEKLVTPQNIKSFDLHLCFESSIADIYSKNDNETFIFILHVKNMQVYSKDNDYLQRKYENTNITEDVDWFENQDGEYSDEKEYITERL